MPFRLVTLGAPLALLRPDGEAEKFPNSKHLALLAYLTLEPGEYSRTVLTRFIWSAGEPGSMSDALSALRSVFGKDVVPPRTDRIAFDPSHLLTCDAIDFRVLASQVDIPNARKSAIALYRGPFFEDFNTRGASSRLLRWIEERRGELERFFVAVCERECAEAAAAGRWDDVAATATVALQRAPDWDGGKRWLALAQERLSPSPPDQSSLAQPAVVVTERAGGRLPALDSTLPARSTRPLLLWGIGGSVGLLALLTVLRMLFAPDRPRGDESTNSIAAQCAFGEAQAQLIEEVFHYGVRMRPGRAFAKRWTLQNSGDCTWGRNFRLHHVSHSGPQLSATIMDIPVRRSIPPRDTVQFQLNMRAPTTPGDYSEHWELRDGGNNVVPVGSERGVVAMIRVPLPHYPTCAPGEGSGILLARKYPERVVKRPREGFRYSWTIKNDGECAWGAGARLRFERSAGPRLTRGDSIIVTRAVEPGETYTFLVEAQTPAASGVYQEEWELRSGSGALVPVDRLPTVTMPLRVQAPDVPVTLAAICNPGEARVRFLDENWPDSSVVAPGQEFVKRWTVINMGGCAWAADYRLEFTTSRGATLSRSREPRPLGEIVPPEAAYTFEVSMRGPSRPGFYRDDWRFVDNRGELIMIGTAPYLAALIAVRE